MARVLDLVDERGGVVLVGDAGLSVVEPGDVPTDGGDLMAAGGGLGDDTGAGLSGGPNTTILLIDRSLSFRGRVVQALCAPKRYWLPMSIRNGAPYDG
jgi:hypothetical protein